MYSPEQCLDSFSLFVLTSLQVEFSLLLLNCLFWSLWTVE
uniref:Uncharacterized protein n=1 Tax=Rhizophora mucronata TaxID=61149 RepID=A0A2P2QI50_RHIMU